MLPWHVQSYATAIEATVETMRLQARKGFARVLCSSSQGPSATVAVSVLKTLVGTVSEGLQVWIEFRSRSPGGDAQKLSGIQTKAVFFRHEHCPQSWLNVGCR